MACIHHGSINLSIHIAKWISFWNLQLQRILQGRLFKPTWVFEKIAFLGLFFFFLFLWWSSCLALTFSLFFCSSFLIIVSSLSLFELPNIKSESSCYHKSCMKTWDQTSDAVIIWLLHSLWCQWGSYASWSMLLLNRSLNICDCPTKILFSFGLQAWYVIRTEVSPALWLMHLWMNLNHKCGEVLSSFPVI